MNKDYLHKKFQELENSGKFENNLLDKIRDWIENTDPLSRNRINPYTIESTIHVGLNKIIPIFLTGVTKGLFNLHWDFHCPHCNVITDEFDSLSQATGSNHCKMCNIDYSADFKNRVSVTFSLPREIDDFSAPPSCRPPESLDVKVYMGLPFGTESEVDFELEAGRYRYYCPVTLTKGILEVKGEPATEVQELEIEQLADGHYNVEKIEAHPGRFHLTAKNKSVPISGIYLHEDILPDEILPSKIEPRLSGLELIHYPEFAEFFGTDTLSNREELSVSSVTVLFTDIKSSTAMYEKLGDAKAYNIVRDHFDILMNSIVNYGGKVVKTVGDAIMASFLKSDDALYAIFFAMNEFQNYNKGKPPEEQVILRTGIHKGPAILVNLNDRIDFFGSTINRAARYESLSGENELTFSENILSDPRTKFILKGYGVPHLKKRTVSLKGIEGDNVVYTISLNN